jgi:hypothetical protein
MDEFGGVVPPPGETHAPCDSAIGVGKRLEAGPFLAVACKYDHDR